MTKLEWVRYCISGIQNCFPEIYYGDAQGKNYSRKTLWNQKNSKDFAVEVMNWTASYNLEDSLAKLQKWESQLKQGLPLDATLPPEETLKVYEELEKQKENASKYAIEKANKDALLLSQQHRETVELKAFPNEKIDSKGVETIGIKEIREKGDKKVSSDISTAYDRLKFSWAGPSPSLPLFVRGISADLLEKKSLTLDEKKREEINKLIVELKKYEEAYAGYARRVRPLSPKDIMLLTSAGSGFNQSEVFLLMRPQAEGGIMAVPNQSFLGKIFSDVGQQVFGEIINKGIEKVISSAATQTVATAATTAAGGATAGAAAGAAAGSIAGPVGTAVGFLAGLVSSKTVSKISEWISQNKEAAVGLILLIGGFGLVALGAPMIVAALPIALGGLSLLGAAAGGLGAVGNSIGGFGNAVLTGITAVVVPSIAGPLIGTMVGLPVVVAIILFIINTGAYIVPPDQEKIFGAVISPYIEVVKTANPSGPFQNSNLPLMVEYSVTIKAKKGTLTNIVIKDDCSVTKRGTVPLCPTPDSDLSTIKIGDISPTQPFTLKYKRVYNTTFQDSLVMDSFTVTADSTEQKSAIASGFASIKIGTPPEECPSIWPLSGSFPVTQGPRSNGCYNSHAGLEAIDIGTNRKTGYPVLATHGGTITAVCTHNCGNYSPQYIDISSTCGGKAFTSRYGHLSVVSVKVGEKVSLGQQIGNSGNGGSGPHLHYEFRHNSLKMTVPFIPKNIPISCDPYCNKPCGSIP